MQGAKLQLPARDKQVLLWSSTAQVFAIAALSLWLSISLDRPFDWLLEQPLVVPFFLCLIAARLLLMVGGFTVDLTHWRRVSPGKLKVPAPGTWSFAWIIFQVALVLATTLLVVAFAGALVAGLRMSAPLFQAVMLLVWFSANLFLAAGVVRQMRTFSRGN